MTHRKSWEQLGSTGEHGGALGAGSWELEVGEMGVCWRETLHY